LRIAINDSRNVDKEFIQYKGGCFVLVLKTIAVHFMRLNRIFSYKQETLKSCSDRLIAKAREKNANNMYGDKPVVLKEQNIMKSFLNSLNPSSMGQESGRSFLS
jgi:hypothetical protein